MKTTIKKCLNCKKEYAIVQRRAEKSRYCSIVCKNKYAIGEHNSRWKGGRFHSSNGYIWLYKPDHPFANKCDPKGYILEHRFIMEQKIGRYLKRGEVVHHINGVRDDNGIENLVLTTSSINISISNSIRPVTESYRKKRSDIAKRIKRNNRGIFTK